MLLMDYTDKYNESYDALTASEAAVAYGSNAPAMSVEEFSRVMCEDDEMFEELKAHGFYQNERPVDVMPDDFDAYLMEIESSGRDRYASSAAVERIRNVWKHVS